MKKGLVSVVIPTYKREPEMLKRALDSVACQTYKDLEVIVVDDSPDDFEKRPLIKELVTGYDKLNITYIQHETNKGGAAARNTGIEASNGEFVALLDDDDEWLPEKTEKQLALMSDKDVGLVYCREYIVDSQTLEKTLNSRDYRKGFVFKHLIINNFIGGNSFILIRRSVLDDSGWFNPVMKSAQDAELFLRISRKCKVDYCDEPLLNYYMNHGEQITGNPYNKIQGFEFIDKKYAGYLFFHPIKKAIRLEKLIPFYKKTDKKKAIKTLWKVVFLTPYKIKKNIDLLRQIKYTMQDVRKENNK